MNLKTKNKEYLGHCNYFLEQRNLEKYAIEVEKKDIKTRKQQPLVMK
jgi:hypothetical protein